MTDYEYTTVNSTTAYLFKVKRDTGVGNLNLITQYDYDSAGNVTKVTDPDSNITTYTVNDLNQVIMAVEPLSVTRKYHFDENDQLTQSEVSNDTATGNSWFVVDYLGGPGRYVLRPQRHAGLGAGAGRRDRGHR